MDERIRKAIMEQVEKEPFGQKFGIKLVALDHGYSRVEMNFTQDMRTSSAWPTEGPCLPLSTRPSKRPPTPRDYSVALNMNVTYISSPSPGSKLIAEAREFS